MKKLLAAAAALLAPIALAVPPASAASPIIVRVHDSWSWSDTGDDCGLALTITGDAHLNVTGRTAKDITLPDAWAYGHVRYMETVTLATGAGSVTQTFRTNGHDLVNTYTETDGVVVSLYRESASYRLRDDSGKLIKQVTGAFYYRVTNDYNTGDLVVEPLATHGNVDDSYEYFDAYFASFCDTVTPYLT
ncbi:MAG: hypothetical protein ABI438_06360 [Dermatophilaceae bacterium]